MPEAHFNIIYDGRAASRGYLNLYDASISYHGLARTLSIIGHYYETGKIVAHAPRSQTEIYLTVAEEGSFKQTLVAATVGAIVSAPFGIFASKIFERWIPPTSDPQLSQIVELLEEQNRLLRKEDDLPPSLTPNEEEEEAVANQFIDKHNDETQVLRSVTSNSFKNIFRPIGNSANTIAITSGRRERPVRVVDYGVLQRIESDRVDDKFVTISGIVNSFSRSSKTGVMHSLDVGRGFRFEFIHNGRLERNDLFSWSQYTGKEIRVEGKFVRFFDGNIKKLLVYYVENESAE